MKSLTDDTAFARLLAWLASAVFRHQRLFLYPQLVLFVVCVVYTGFNLKFDMSRNDLVGSNKKYHQNFLQFKKEFPTQDDLVVVVESENAEKNRQFVERLGAKLEAETNLFRDVFYKGDLKMLGSKALLFVPEADLAELKKTLQDYRPFIEQFTRATNLVSLFNMVNARFRTATRETNAQTESLVKALPALERIVEQAEDSLIRSGTPPSPGITALFNPGADAEQQIYVTFANGRIYLVTAQAPKDELNGAAVERLSELVEEVKTQVPGLNVGLTGEPVLEHDEMVQSQKDTTVASIASLVICALIFIYGYQQTGRPIKATICLIVGLGYTLAFATLVIGHLNILTITFVPILIGLAIDYGVHLISRYEEELRRGKSEQDALAKAMGIICGGGLVVCLVPMMTMLPVLLLRGQQNVIDHAQGDLAERRARIERLWLQRPVLVTILTVSLTTLALTQIPKVYFDYNLLHMQSAGLPAVVFEKKLIDSTPKSVLYAAVIATNLPQAMALELRIKKLPAVEEVESMAKYLAENQVGKLAIIGDIKQGMAAIRFNPPDPGPVNIPEFSRTLYSLHGYLGAALPEVQKEEPALSKQFISLREAIERLRKEMLDDNPARVEPNSLKLAEFQQALFQDVRETFQAMQDQDNRAPLSIADLPAALHDRFVGVTGRFLLMVYPKKDLWQRENQKEFIDQLRQIDPNVTGTPVQLYEYTTLLKNSYQEAAWYALGAIALLVFIHFHSPLSVALALVPVSVGFIWLGGLMGWFDIPLNPANIMTLPLVIGIGVTNGIHILNRFAEEHTPSILARSTGKAVFVSGLTTIAGFGSLILAKHRGIQSLGYVMATGVAMCMIAGLTFLPALLNLLMRRREPEKTTQCRQCTIDTGSGGTEVKTSSVRED